MDEFGVSRFDLEKYKSVRGVLDRESYKNYVINYVILSGERNFIKKKRI